MYQLHTHINIKHSQLMILFHFLEQLCEKVSIADYYNGYLPKDECRCIQTELEIFIEKKHQEMRQDYTTNKNGFKDFMLERYTTSERVEEYFIAIQEQDKSNLKPIDCETYSKYEKVKDLSEELDHIETKYTRISPVTCGPIFRLQYFTLDTTYKSIICQMDSLFQFPYSIDNVSYEDLAFYNNDRIIFSICSHEQFATLFLSDEEYEKLQEIKDLIGIFKVI